ncbi:uncharacterized protein ATNIH1004_006835 [Aspergillus tanneri]|uniref:Uncharacterized protein n=1 Tax=Aspergillus tanneri TaxID=1220188 RepID=A0A5M9MHX0_9EURO|nr:uncharacterized protein ATNIH1004_006835 [Aspergillus tanneri]KAA8645416.1 hypothetical protein ATNIH1004_006835 [Aspergillus tanneri]
MSGSGSAGRRKVYSTGVVYSTRLNAQRLPAGQPTCLAQWEDVDPLEIDPSTFVLPQSRLIHMEQAITAPAHSFSSHSLDRMHSSDSPNTLIPSASPAPEMVAPHELRSVAVTGRSALWARSVEWIFPHRLLFAA